MQHSILVLGGTGFIGRHVVAKLAAAGHRITVLTRKADRARPLQMLPTVEVVVAKVADEAALASYLPGKTAVINLVGVLHSKPGAPYGPDFAQAHVELPKTLIRAMRSAGVQRLLHMSALGAIADGPSMYSRSKAAGEALVKDSGLAWTIFQPSVVFGPDDQFLNTFASLAKVLPILALAGAQAKLQPVYVEDVAQAFVNALANPATAQQSYALAGPQVYTLKQLMQFASTAAIGRARPVLALPALLGKLQAFLFECLPGPTLISRDNLDSLRVDNVCRAPDLLRLGITATAMEAIASQYLAGKHPRTRSDAHRAGYH